MRYPLDTEIVITGRFLEKAQPGTGLKDAKGVSRHIGIDLRALKPTNVYAPGPGLVTSSYTAASGNQIIELLIADKLWRFLHLSDRKVSLAQTVKEGQIIGKSGNTGGVQYHLHMDIRRSGFAWDASINNYIDPEQYLYNALKKEEEMTKDQAYTLADQLSWQFTASKIKDSDQKIIADLLMQGKFETALKEVTKWDSYKAFVAKQGADQLQEKINKAKEALK